MESQAERLNRINTLYDSEDEEMEMEIGRSVVEDVNEKWANMHFDEVQLADQCCTISQDG